MRIWLLLLLATTPAWASHDWFGVDLCRSQPGRMPPVLAPADLPEPDTSGARLVVRHCGQCHNMPGPGHHTAEEWRRVAAKMFLLSEVTARFGGRPQLVIPDQVEREIITTYLERHALRPLPAGADAPRAYLSACGDCHAAPDPGLHSATAWPAVMARMAGHRAIMTREPLDPLSATRVLAYLSEHAAPNPGEPAVAGRWAALAPVLALAGFALWRLSVWMKKRGSPGGPVRRRVV
jgi:cytochrome c5